MGCATFIRSPPTFCYRSTQSHWENYCKGKAEAGAGKCRDWRVARAICVLDDDKWRRATVVTIRRARIDLHYEQMRAKMKRGKRLYVFKSHKEQPDEEITHDCCHDHCVIHGGVKVVDQIPALREEIGDFGELVYAGMDWAEPALNKRSMQLMAEEVSPGTWRSTPPPA